MSEKSEKKVKKMTMSKLSREYHVSRQALYKLFDKKGWDKTNITQETCELIKIYYGDEKNKRKDSSKKVKAANQKAKSLEKKDYSLPGIEVSTIKQRLENKRQEYNYNRDLITTLQLEINEYRESNGGTTMKNHTGSQAAIPQIAQLEKYINLNLKIDKHIQELEDILGLDDEKEDNPFE